MLLTMIGGVINEQEVKLLVEHKQTEIYAYQPHDEHGSSLVRFYGQLFALWKNPRPQSRSLYYRNMAEHEFDSLYALVKDDAEMRKLLERLKKLSDIEFNRFVENHVIHHVSRRHTR